MTTTYHNPGNSFLDKPCLSHLLNVGGMVDDVYPSSRNSLKVNSCLPLQGTPFFHGSMVCNPTSPTAGERSTFHLHYFQSFAHYEAAKYLWFLRDAEASGKTKHDSLQQGLILKKQPFSKGFPNIANETPQWSMLHGFIPKGFDESELGQAFPVARNNTHLLWPRIHGWFRGIGMVWGVGGVQS